MCSWRNLKMPTTHFGNTFPCCDTACTRAPKAHFSSPSSSLLSRCVSLSWVWMLVCMALWFPGMCRCWRVIVNVFIFLQFATVCDSGLRPLLFVEDEPSTDLLARIQKVVLPSTHWFACAQHEHALDSWKYTISIYLKNTCLHLSWNDWWLLVITSTSEDDRSPSAVYAAQTNNPSRHALFACSQLLSLDIFYIDIFYINSLAPAFAASYAYLGQSCLALRALWL